MLGVVTGALRLLAAHRAHWNNLRIAASSWLLVASVYATSDDDRVDITYGQYLNIMQAAGFRQHEAFVGTLRPPQRFKHLPNGEQLLIFNPCGRSLGCEMLKTMQAKLQSLMRELYGLELEDFSVVRKQTWEDPADPNDPVPIVDLSLVPTRWANGLRRRAEERQWAHHVLVVVLAGRRTMSLVLGDPRHARRVFVQPPVSSGVCSNIECRSAD
ncbi:hypothetical protein OH76DRAFT_1485643 [Lentinus brumalis]|uniref:Uncharacterized protein n=1 Tax=Lentinus brumalis TaxID=2498619 RepID=A0A371D0Z2_9APHY|nr:hypothetical protein OH76DRAFT_1485643 [Polyporus brumalis]